MKHRLFQESIDAGDWPVKAPDVFIPARTKAEAEEFARRYLLNPGGRARYEYTQGRKATLGAINEVNHALYDMTIKRGLPKIDGIYFVRDVQANASAGWRFGKVAVEGAEKEVVQTYINVSLDNMGSVAAAEKQRRKVGDLLLDRVHKAGNVENAIKAEQATIRKLEAELAKIQDSFRSTQAGVYRSGYHDATRSLEGQLSTSRTILHELKREGVKGKLRARPTDFSSYFHAQELPGQTKIYNTICHEFGHTLHFRVSPELIVKRPGDWGGRWGEAISKTFQAEKFSFDRSTPLMYPPRGSGIKFTQGGTLVEGSFVGEYAQVNIMELFAEAFSMYQAGAVERMPQVLIDWVEDAIEELLKMQARERAGMVTGTLVRTSPYEIADSRAGSWVLRYRD